MIRKPPPLPAAFLLAAALLPLSLRPAAAAAPRLELRDGDRLAWLGATFVERLQAFGHLEALLTAAGGRELQFRNLGWSGDEVTGVSRAVFGSAEEGFQRMQRDLQIAAPTLVVVQYGAVEAERGESGEQAFAKQLSRLLDALEKRDPRVALMTPLHRTRPRPALPDPAPYNARLDRYCQLLAAAAGDRGLPLIDVRDLLSKVDSDNGLVPTANGYRQIAPLIAARMGLVPLPWSVRIDIGSRSYDAVETAISEIDWDGESGVPVRFQTLDRRLPSSSLPFQSRLQVSGLAEGQYALQLGSRTLHAASGRRWAAGVMLPERGGIRQYEQLRQTIVDKNALFFHRHRPQNETYLFLFRKHEQGNNAVEVPQFDPLISQLEGRIVELRTPRPQSYRLVRQ